VGSRLRPGWSWREVHRVQQILHRFRAGVREYETVYIVRPPTIDPVATDHVANLKADSRAVRPEHVEVHVQSKR
jgi:hypothetical protein